MRGSSPDDGQDEVTRAFRTVRALSPEAPRRQWEEAFDALFSAARTANDDGAYVQAVRDRAAVAMTMEQLDIARALVESARERVPHDSIWELELAVLGAIVDYHESKWDRCAEKLVWVEERCSQLEVELPTTWLQAEACLAGFRLEDDAAETLHDAVSQYREFNDRANQSICLIVLADLLVISGRPSEAKIAADEAAEVGTVLGARIPWRATERAVINCSRLLAAGRFEEYAQEWHEALELAKAAHNERSGRRLWALKAREAYLRQDMAELARGLSREGVIAARRSPLYRGGTEGYRHLEDDLSGRTPSVAPSILEDATSWGLGGVLAAGEILATSEGGSRRTAEEWLRWATEAHGIVTAVDWPVLLDRVAALVAVRLGGDRNHRLAVRRFIRAMRRSDIAPIEASIAKLQLAEWGLREGLREQRFDLYGWRREAVTELYELGLSTTPHVAQVLRAWALAHDKRDGGGLTPREVDVLRCYAQGMLQAETAEHLGVSVNTIKTLTSRAYDRLGARDRRDAVEKALKRGLI